MRDAITFNVEEVKIFENCLLKFGLKEIAY
jgi:hypothetical protein